MSSATYNRTIFPDDIFDTIVELIAKDLPDVSVATTRTRRSSSRALLKHLATVSPHLRNLCQAVIFQNITIFPTKGQPSWLADSQYVEDYPEAAWSSSITLFRNNPRLFDYARTLELVLETSDFTTRMPSHFEAVVIPFFLDNLRHLEGISVGHSPNSLFLWSCLDTRSQEAIRNCIAKNSLKSFAVSNCHLPRSFLGLLPSTMETLRINEWCHFPSPADDGLGSAAITACPTSLDFKTSMTLKDLPQSSILSQVSDEFFHRVISLAVHPNRSFSIETLKREVLDRVPPSIKHLTLKYHGPVRRIGLNWGLTIRQSHEQIESADLGRRFPSVETLKLDFILTFGGGNVACPDIVPEIILGNCVFPALQKLFIKISGSGQLFRDRNEEEDVDTPIFDPSNLAFSMLDDHLSLGAACPLLRLVHIRIERTPRSPSGATMRIDELLRAQARQALNKTANKIDMFDVEVCE